MTGIKCPAEQGTLNAEVVGSNPTGATQSGKVLQILSYREHVQRAQVERWVHHIESDAENKTSRSWSLKATWQDRLSPRDFPPDPSLRG
ncbi:hypothetical protein NQZ68_030542 [Dissostichus eleginoides]|nr:hypothetical protein NQZ68_030542 [Dissostichus eleginoides]